MLRNGLFLASALLLSACSTPSFLGNKAAQSPSFLGASKPALHLESQYSADLSSLPDDVAAFLLESNAPPAVIVQNAPVVIAPLPEAPVAAAAQAPAIPSRTVDNPLSHSALAYLQALYRGDGETAWRYATVAPNPKQSWWDSNTAKGALLMKAGSSEYFAAEKRGVTHIDIPPGSISQQGNDARLIAHITYGNGSSSDMNLHLINQGGTWLVAEE